MLEFLNNLLSSDGFMPHGHCYLWRPALVWLHVLSDGLIALAYTSIPCTLMYFIRRRRGVPFHWMFLCFGAFIVACGATHVMEIWTLWTPTYWLAGAFKAITAAASVPTAILLVKLIPTALAIPTPRELAMAHDDLRRAHDDLERRVAERTAELTRKNDELAREIADRKRAEHQFRRLADAGIIGIISTDTRGNIHDANTAFLDMVGYTADDMRAGKLRWTDMTPPEYRALTERVAHELRTTGAATVLEKEYIRKDGSRVPVVVGVATLDDTGENIAFVLDRSERARDADAIRRLEQQREADAKVVALLEAAPDAMVITNARGHIVLVNAQTEQLFGYPRADLLGASVELLVPERFRANHADHRAGYFRSPTGRRAMGAGRQLVGLRRDGTEFPADISLNQLQTREGPLVSTTIRDVTERKHTEEALQRAKDAAEAANAELETFSYSVAHDLRSPLRGMSGYATALLEDHADRLGADATEHLHRIVDGASRMGEIIDALLKLARLTRTEPRREPVDLTKLGRSIIDNLRATDPTRHVDFIAADDLVVHGDPELLRVLLDNLLGNAWKFTSKRPTAHVELGRDDLDGIPGFFVRDDGAGFDLRLVDKLFVPFRRLHAPTEFEGTGLGLATVQRIVRNHGGRVWAEGAEAHGATFHFTLPTPPRPRSPSRSHP